MVWSGCLPRPYERCSLPPSTSAEKQGVSCNSQPDVTLCQEHPEEEYVGAVLHPLVEQGGYELTYVSD